MFKSSSNARLVIASSVSLLGLGLGAAAFTPTAEPSSVDIHKSCKQLIKRYKEEYGIPGIVVAVSQDGHTLFSRGFGYSDVENNVKATPGTLMRIASISKPLTCTLAGVLYERGLLDLDAPVSAYLDDLPEFTWRDRSVAVTSRQLMSHSAGVRHYAKEGSSPESECPEFLLNKQFKSSRSALDLFINDALKFEPGKGYLYSTFGYTLLGAVLEKCNSGVELTSMLAALFRALDMHETFVDVNRPLIAGRSKFYERSKESGKLVNVPEVDCSYKYAGGGLVSTAGDLLK